MRRYERGRELHAVSEEYRAQVHLLSAGHPTGRGENPLYQTGCSRPRRELPLPPKRVPPPPVAPDFSKLKDEDFTL